MKTKKCPTCGEPIYGRGREREVIWVTGAGAMKMELMTFCSNRCGETFQREGRKGKEAERTRPGHD